MADRKYPFSQVDAFTQERLKGNPCAIILNADDLSDVEMLSIAREMNLSETAFVLKSSKADFRFRFFTPAEEIPLAGHPTVATVFRLLELGKVSSSTSLLKIELQVGIIEVGIERKSTGCKIAMRQLPPKFLNTYAANEIMPLFGLTAAEVLPGLPLQTVSTGTPILMIPLKDRLSLDRIQFDASRFAKYRGQTDFLSGHLFVLEGKETFARNFWPPPDVIEDPFTGSATGAMGCYLWKYGLVKRSEFIANQGSHLQRPGQAAVKIFGEATAISGVEVSGHAITCLQGELLL